MGTQEGRPRCWAPLLSPTCFLPSIVAGYLYFGSTSSPHWNQASVKEHPGWLNGETVGILAVFIPQIVPQWHEMEAI